MNRELSIRLHLAKVTNSGAGVYWERNTGARGHYLTCAWHGGRRYNPYANRSQWADVVLWYVSTTGKTLEFFGLGTYSNGLSLHHENTIQENVKASLELIAIATGWKPHGAQT